MIRFTAEASSMRDVPSRNEEQKTGIIKQKPILSAVCQISSDTKGYMTIHKGKVYPEES